jgi:LAO/AO transport system kinase
MWTTLAKQLKEKNTKALARLISLVENEVEGYKAYLQSLPYTNNTPIIGITGPPGAGKSTLTDALIGLAVAEGKSVAVLCVDPSSPFNLGAVLGDRIRMSQWYTNEKVFIRSLATRGALGGLHPKIIELTDVVAQAWFDLVIVETVGVGQSEIEIAGLADVTTVVLVPEAGDEVQTMKAGLMEIADVFVVNKADRPAADKFVHYLKSMLAPAFIKKEEVKIFKTIAAENIGIKEWYEQLKKLIATNNKNEKRFWLLAEKAWHIIMQEKMKGVNKLALKAAIESAYHKDNAINLYSFIDKFK